MRVNFINEGEGISKYGKRKLEYFLWCWIGIRGIKVNLWFLIYIIDIDVSIDVNVCAYICVRVCLCMCICIYIFGSFVYWEGLGVVIF